MLVNHQRHRMLEQTCIYNGPGKLKEMIRDGWKIVGTYGYNSLVLAKGKRRRLIDKTGKYAMVEYEDI